MRHACLLALLAALAVALVPQAGARQQRGARDLAAERAAMVNLIDLIATHRDETWRWERLMHRQPTPSGNLALQMRSIAHSRRVLQLWQRRAAVAKREALNPPHKREWLCIHRYEGSWRDPDAPYYGGLQMDLEFQTTYGRSLLHRKGTAEHWTPLEQMWVAERAYRTRGYWPWPNTARYCGLL